MAAYLNISIVNSLNFACSTAEPTMRISCKDNVICGERSHGGVVNGDNLEPEPLNSIKQCRHIDMIKEFNGPCFRNYE